MVTFYVYRYYIVVYVGHVLQTAVYIMITNILCLKILIIAYVYLSKHFILITIMYSTYTHNFISNLLNKCTRTL